MTTFGASFSTKACAQYNLKPEKVLEAALSNLGARRFRLMTYWDEIEQERDVYDFSSIKSQLEIVARYPDAEVSLCIGVRQPRWPECHLPEWVKQLSEDEFEQAALRFVKASLEACASHPSITSFQLENEFYNKGIGLCANYSRPRLIHEFELVRQYAGGRPILMSASNNWSLPLRSPRPDIIGFSIYRYQHNGTKQTNSVFPATWYRARATALKSLGGVQVICHELQAEPWGEKGTDQLPLEQQLDLMNAERFNEHVAFALRAGMPTIDLWGLEWWYWLWHDQRKPEMWEAAQAIFAASGTS